MPRKLLDGTDGELNEEIKKDIISLICHYNVRSVRDSVAFVLFSIGAVGTYAYIHEQNPRDGFSWSKVVSAFMANQFPLATWCSAFAKDYVETRDKVRAFASRRPDELKAIVTEISAEQAFQFERDLILEILSNYY